MKKIILLSVLISSCYFISCDEMTSSTTTTDQDTSTVKAQVNQPEKPAPQAPAAKVVKPEQLERVGQIIAFSSFNTKVRKAKDEAWVKSPFQVALKFGGDQMEARKKVISAESLSGGEVYDKLLITIEEDGLLDDSVKGTMTILRLEKTGDLWLIQKASRVWKCYPNRGHVAFNSEPCQ